MTLSKNKQLWKMCDLIDMNCKKLWVVYEKKSLNIDDQ